MKTPRWQKKMKTLSLSEFRVCGLPGKGSTISFFFLHINLCWGILRLPPRVSGLSGGAAGLSSRLCQGEGQTGSSEPDCGECPWCPLQHKAQIWCPRRSKMVGVNQCVCDKFRHCEPPMREGTQGSVRASQRVCR